MLITPGSLRVKKSYLYGVELNAVNSVHTPSKAANRVSPVLIPNVNLLSACRKDIILPVMVNATVEILEKRL